jgi:hypothetical protein
VTSGLLYDRSRVALVAFAVIAQLVSVPFFMLASRAAPQPRTASQ